MASLSLNFSFSAMYSLSSKLLTFVLLDLVSLLSKVSNMRMIFSSSTVVAGRPVHPIQAAITFSFESNLYLDAAKAAWMDGCFAPPDLDLEGITSDVLVSGVRIWSWVWAEQGWKKE